MTQTQTTQAKKPSAAQPAAKMASAVANKAARQTYAAVESTRSSAENVVKIGGKAVKEFISTSAGEAQKAQEKAFAMGREGAETFAKSADAVTKALYETIGLSRDGIETCIECGNMTAELAKDLSSEALDYANRTFSEQLELSKGFFSCRTLGDMFELQNRVVKNNIDSFFSQSTKLSERLFDYTTEALEPINERVAQATEQFSKALAA
ncbi:MAG: phasin family protein [Pseudomonadota bacterium]|nr:phasin family protein [Pseudomonadota bacterium]MDE3038887.1 phasin family protein [Pseudomonadota bacterium]